MSFVTRLLADQPDPTGDGPSVVDYALERTRDARVADLLRARREQGIERYGTELRAGNGRDVEADLAQEVIDALIYARQLEMQGGSKWFAEHLEQVLRLLVGGVGWRG